jgi:hypothetical protein
MIFTTTLYVGQGSKVCPFTDPVTISMPHVHASRDALKSRLLHDRATRLQGSSPSRDIFQKTSAFVTALRKRGCGAPAHETTYWSPAEQIDRKKHLELQSKLQRGYISPEITCDGRLLFDYDGNEQPYIRFVIYISL